MKQQLLTVKNLLGLMLIATLVLFSSCKEKEEIDDTESCKQCHNGDSKMTAKLIQASVSWHQAGGNFERSDSGCAPCHTHEGFVERLVTGEQETAEPKNPSPIGCRTCHNIHDKYDSTDWALKTTDAVTLWTNGVVVDAGKANLCINCHQPSVMDPMPVAGGADVSYTSKYSGPHHGTQGAVLAGTGAYDDGITSTAHAHSNISNACITCHMATPYGAQAGGHTFNMTYSYHGHNVVNTAGCYTGGCHSSKTEDELADMLEEGQDEIQVLLDSLQTLLQTDSDTVLAGTYLNASTDNPLTISADKAGAYLNYKTVAEDRSLGIHNPTYVKAILKKGITIMNTK